MAEKSFKTNPVAGKTPFSGSRYEDDYIDVLTRELDKSVKKVSEVSINKIMEKENVRKDYKGLEELAKSIEEKGLLQPITLKKLENEKDKYEIVFGHRRYRAMSLLFKNHGEKYSKIQAIVLGDENMSEDEIKEVQLVENIQREDLSQYELKEALEVLKKQGLSHKEIAGKLGKSEGYVKNIFQAIKQIKDNSEIEELLKSHTGVTLKDIQIVNPLPSKNQIALLKEKAEGKIKTRKELESRMFSLREELSDKDSERYEAKKNYDFMSMTSNKVKIKSFSFDIVEIQKDKEKKEKIISLLENTIKLLEGSKNLELKKD